MRYLIIAVLLLPSLVFAEGFGVIDCDFLSGISVVNTYSKEHEATGKCYVWTTDKNFPFGTLNTMGGATLFARNIKDLIDLANTGHQKARGICLKFIRVENLESGVTPVRRSLQAWFDAGKPGGANVTLFPKYNVFGFEHDFSEVTKQNILDLQ